MHPRCFRHHHASRTMSARSFVNVTAMNTCVSVATRFSCRYQGSCWQQCAEFRGDHLWRKAIYSCSEFISSAFWSSRLNRQTRTPSLKRHNTNSKRDLRLHIAQCKKDIKELEDLLTIVNFDIGIMNDILSISSPSF